MPLLRHEVRHTAGATTTVLPGVTSLVIEGGRGGVQEPLRASTVTITGNNPSALPTITIDDTLQVMSYWGAAVYPSQSNTFSFNVSNFSVKYGINGNADTWTLEGEDAFARIGRYPFSTQRVRAAGSAPVTDAGALTYPTPGILVELVTGDAGTITKCSAQTFDIGDNLFDAFQGYVRTEQAFAYAGRNTIAWKNRREKWDLTPSVEFTDGTLTASITTAKYYDISFASSADTSSQMVVVMAAGLGGIAVGTGNRTAFVLDSYDQTLEQAGYLAGYVLGTLNAANNVPRSISWNSEAQSSDVPITILGVALGRKARINVVLRGTRYDCVVEGFTITAGLQATDVTLNLSSFEAYKFFKLDSATQGTLDSNRLGY